MPKSFPQVLESFPQVFTLNQWVQGFLGITLNQEVKNEKIDESRELL